MEAYATSIFSSEPEKLEKFKVYISSSKNPAINSLMYVPLNAAIIVEIYCNCKSEHLLPHTLTGLYMQLTLTVLNRHLRIQNPSVSIQKFEDLPPNLYQEFLKLSKVAYEGFKKEEVIFQSFPSNLIHFGFLDSVSALYGGGGVSYNFLHLTVQEFFAAYHISHLGSSGLEVFQRYGKAQRWNVVWRFVAGLTKFRYIEGHIERNMFIEKYVDELQFSLLLVQCLLEAQSVGSFFSTLKPFLTAAKVVAIDPTALDAYALGYCIANFPIGVPWDVVIRGAGHHSFTCGLSTNMPSVGVINTLDMMECPLHFADLQSNPLVHTTALNLVSCGLTSTDMVHLSEFIPQLSCLSKLNIRGNKVIDSHHRGFLKVLHQLYNSNVISLDIRCIGLDNFFRAPH